MNLEGMTCVVTGAASGIGKAIAARFIAEGARVAMVDRDQELLIQAASEISDDSNGITVVGSVDDPALAEETARAVHGRWSRLDCLVTAAAISKGGIATATSDETWDEVFSVNVKGTFLWCKAVLPYFLSAQRGSIITVASQLALSGGRGNASYVASKGAVISMTRSLALDYATSGVRANALVPAAIDTPLLQRSFARQEDPGAAKARSVARHPMGRFGRSAEVAAAAVFLASDQSSFTTGAILPVDGGWLIG
ncbi:SDR family oxidoreductase [Pseudochelatococcus sp. B33]